MCCLPVWMRDTRSESCSFSSRCNIRRMVRSARIQSRRGGAIPFTEIRLTPVACRTRRFRRVRRSARRVGEVKREGNLFPHYRLGPENETLLAPVVWVLGVCELCCVVGVVHLHRGEAP